MLRQLPLFFDDRKRHHRVCAVRAALFGRVLVIDGVEKAERNVLPILNSLLESREMQLDDGRFLIPASKYDKLAKEYGENELRAKQLERVSEDFFVIALGLPVPPFKGYALDPPLRSRFQCRQIGPLSFSDLYEKCCSVAPNIPSDQISNLVSMCLAMNSSEARSTALPSFPIDSFLQLATIWNTMPSLEAERVFELAYPYSAFLKSDVHYPVLNEFLDKFSVTRKKSKCNAKLLSTDRNTNRAAIVWNDSERYINTIFGVNSGTFSPRITYVPNAEHDRLLSEMALCHGIGDFCLLGPRGSGKTTVVEEFAKRFNYEPTTIMMYQDMNSRELLQQRKMLDNGDTVWEDSVLVQCAKSGGLCVLDGIERAHWSSVEVLAPLIHHRQIDLFDGTRLVSCGQFKKLMEASGKTKRQLEESGIFEILPSFRIIAIGDSESGPQWLNDQIRSLFLFVTTDSLNAESQCTVIQKLVPGCDMLATKILVSLVERLRNSADPGLRGVSNSLTLRKIIYLCKRQVLHRGENLCAGVRRAALWKFLPVLTRNAFEEELANSGISSSSPHDDNLDDSFRPLTNSSLTGPSSLHCRENFDPTMVPDTLFYDNEQHLKVISDMARDMELGYHLLLIGNQGVGKNKITDRFLHLVNRPRHYLQLHRDTTVQSLTVHSTVVDGRVVLEDSPLVKAARDGHILVIDEADKAPLHVVAVLKSLLDNGVLRLADGRLIEPASQSKGPLSIPLHPDFRIIMLANRPGFPFLGNDLFSLLGDLFSVNIVDNPSRSSELLMLKKYAPSVDDVILDQLCSAFDDLRKLADNLSLPYPYSIRELVNIVKHIERFPNDGVIKAIRNVFDFDQYSDETLEVVEKVFQRHGIPFGVSQRKRKVMLTRAHPIPPLKVVGEWGVRNDVVPLRLHVNTLPIRTNYRSNVSLKEVEMLEQHMRSSIFSEQEFFYQLPFDHRNICSDISSQGSRFAVTTVAPPTLFIGDRNRPDVVQEVDISLLLPPIRAGYKPRIRTCFLPSGQLLVHEEVSNVLLCFDAHSQSLTRLSLNEPSMMHSMFERFTPLSVNAAKRFWRMSSIFPHILFEKNGNGINMIGLNLENYVELELPENFMLNNVTSCGDTNFITMSNCGIHLVTLEDRYAVLREVYSAGDIPSDLLCGRKVKLGGGDKAVFADNKDYYVLTSNAFPPTFSVGELAASPREKTEGYVYSKRPFYVADDLDPLLNSGALVRITSEGTLVRALPLWATPRKAMEGIDKSAVSNVAGFLEVVFPVSEQVQYIPVAKSQ
ncbi:hypothetical protein AB6A40_002605 [Gnathostoma spinigerum]|uniref:ATPase dynein-related AAA domain-containing protein n=1 Tax=Gnathostoma spinigerum TaxID=75299 RepID=A0ABD6EER5_9BILA